jgi:hypothetical protein
VGNPQLLRRSRSDRYTAAFPTAGDGGSLEQTRISMPASQDELALAREAGRLEAEAFDRTLREAEAREREERLGRIAWDSPGEGFRESTGADAAMAVETVWRLQQDVARLAAFHQAVLRSRAWRLIQWARRPFGRAW